jgi:phosphonate transport system permease protein
VLRTSLGFVGVAVLCLVGADLEISTLEPWGELGRIGWGFLTPDVSALSRVGDALVNTITFAFCGLALGVAGGSLLAAVFNQSVTVRAFCACVRAVHELFWAFLFLPVVGLTPICGILAIGIPYAGVFAKVYAEILQEADRRPLAGLPAASGKLSRFFYGVLPVAYPDLRAYTSYRLECALRSSAILGFIGLPTLGFHLETAFREGLYAEAPALLYAFYLLIASLRWWVRPRLVPIYIAVSFALISTDVHLSWDNVRRFLTYEILPWPMRSDGYYAGTGEVVFDLMEIGRWAWDLTATEVVPGAWNTILLTQIALVGTGVFTLLAFPAICRHFNGRFGRALSHYGLIVLRTTPEYILAYALLQLWGPSMLPAVVAILLHNGAILSHLTGGHANTLNLRVDQPQRRSDRYLFEVLPRVYGPFLAFLFYRWEVMMRESAILGILGIRTLGFFIDSAIAEDAIDKAVFLIGATALLNVGIDTISQIIRRRLRVRPGTVFTYD